MGQSYFIWKGTDCRSLGVVMQGPATIIRPEERVEHVQIPGRSGDLTQTEGEAIYNSYIQTANIAVHGGYRVREIFGWLRGAGYVTFSGEPDRRQQARIIGAVTLDRFSKNLDWYTGEVQFYCQPLKEKLEEEKITLTEGGTVYNNGDVEARPLWKVTTDSTGFNLLVNMDITNPRIFAVSGIAAGTYYVDSETMEVWNSDRSALLTKKSTGDFPMMKPGANTVTMGLGTSITSLEITKRERFL